MRDQPRDDGLRALLDEAEAKTITIIMHNLDGEALRQERSQAVISRLVAHPKVSLVASIDHIRAPLLWDAARISQFNFLWHDATTFDSYTVEIPVDEALSLVDGSGRAGGTKGVKYVLASLPSNAKSLFRARSRPPATAPRPRGSRRCTSRTWWRRATGS